MIKFTTQITIQGEFDETDHSAPATVVATQNIVTQMLDMFLSAANTDADDSNVRFTSLNVLSGIDDHPEAEAILNRLREAGAEIPDQILNADTVE